MKKLSILTLTMIALTGFMAITVWAARTRTSSIVAQAALTLMAH